MPAALTVDVALGDRSYPIHIGEGLLAQAGALLKPRLGAGRVLVVADERVAGHHGQALLASLRAAGLEAALAAFPAGEPHKTLATAEILWSRCAAERIDRQGAVVALGGGVPGDVAGFVAACWMRGIRFAQVPTTLLAMVDSSVGGKTGVDTPAGKNLVGAFKQPCAVVIDPAVLATMDGREYRAGLAEVLKYGVIRDPGFLAWQEAHAERLVARDAGAVAHAVAESCRIKAAYVAEDEFEQGVRAHLNYGHTFGHAVETGAGYAAYLHGEGVAIGMRMAVELARRLGVLADPVLAARQDALLTRYGLPLAHRHPQPAAEAARLAALTGLDKKAQAGRVRFVLPERPGSMRIVAAPPAEQVHAAFAHAIEP